MLLALREIVREVMPELDVVTKPGMTIASGDGVEIENPMTGYRLTLVGDVDYAVIRFRDEPQKKDWLLNFAGTMTGELFSQLSDSRIFLINIIRHHEPLTYNEGLDLFMPQAIARSLAWAKVNRFVMSLLQVMDY